MASGSFSSSSSISTISGYCIGAIAEVGSNGTPGGSGEVSVWNSAGTSSSARVTWDQDLSNGFDTNSVVVALTANAGGGSGGLSWSVAGASPSPITYSRATYGVIQRVRIRALVNTNAKAAWSGLSVKFYKAGALTENYSPRGGPAVDQSAVTPPTAAEQMLTVTPTNGDNDAVVVTGNIRMVNAATTLGNPDDMALDLYVDTASCSTS